MALLEIRNIKKTFSGGKPVLSGTSLSVEKGEVVVILGPSGCGKSTLLRCINGLESIQDGEILLGGEVISGRRKDMSLVRQKIGIKNILLAPLKVQRRKKDEVVSEARKWLSRVGLSEKIDAYPRQLSGGQKQRVAIVRALCMHPEIMLFDEVTAALDPEMVREVLDVMMDLARDGMTMLIVTHQMNFARAIADRIVFLGEGGEIVEEAPPGEFFGNPKTQRARKFLESFEFESRH